MKGIHWKEALTAWGAVRLEALNLIRPALYSLVTSLCCLHLLPLCSCFIFLCSAFCCGFSCYDLAFCLLYTPPKMTTSTSLRRRRQSLSGDIASPVALSSEKARALLSHSYAPPRPKSTPAHERLHVRRRAGEDVEPHEEARTEKERMQIDEND